MMMKRLITLLLPLILAADLPFTAFHHIPADWTKSFQYGLKWTKLMLNGYPSDVNAEQVPQGFVTTTVVIAQPVADFEDVEIEISKELCDAELQLRVEKMMKEAVKRHEHEFRMVRIHGVPTIEL
jgi:hypothetical protein